jgi:hypothetical protein
MELYALVPLAAVVLSIVALGIVLALVPARSRADDDGGEWLKFF